MAHVPGVKYWVDLPGHFSLLLDCTSDRLISPSSHRKTRHALKVRHIICGLKSLDHGLSWETVDGMIMELPDLRNITFGYIRPDPRPLLSLASHHQVVSGRLLFAHRDYGELGDFIWQQTTPDSRLTGTFT